MKERFQVHDDTVLDVKTGLVWLKDAGLFRALNWATAQKLVAGLRAGWRLPKIEELSTLIDYEQHNPALPAGHPFTNVLPYSYWSSTTYANDTGSAWDVNMCDGFMYIAYNGHGHCVWPVRNKKKEELKNEKR